MTYGEYPEECQAYLDERMSDSDNAATAQKAATGQFCERAGRDRQTADGPRPLNRTLHIACCRCSLHVCCLVMHACANTQSVMFSCLVVCCLAARGPSHQAADFCPDWPSVCASCARLSKVKSYAGACTHTHTHTRTRTHTLALARPLSLSLSLLAARTAPQTRKLLRW